MEHFTWCRLSADDFSEVMSSSLYHDGQPENLLFTYKVRVSSTWEKHVLCLWTCIKC